jgi:hypothetical protein
MTMKIACVIFLFNFLFISAFAQEADKIFLLTNNNVKYWDRVNTNSSSDFTNKICWRFTKKSKTILEYYYDTSKFMHRYENNHGDYILGEIPFVIKFDTLFLPKIKEEFVIKRMTNDTLVVNEIENNLIGTDILYLKSKNQKQIPIPVLSNITRLKKAPEKNVMRR